MTILQKKKFLDYDGNEIQCGEFILYVTETKAMVYKVIKIDMPYIHLLSLASGTQLIRMDHELDTCFSVSDKIICRYKGI